jgi:hypothetical protein
VIEGSFPIGASGVGAFFHVRPRKSRSAAFSLFVAPSAAALDVLRPAASERAGTPIREALGRRRLASFKNAREHRRAGTVVSSTACPWWPTETCCSSAILTGALDRARRAARSDRVGGDTASVAVPLSGNETEARHPH